MIAITGATGHLGRLVIAELLKTVPASGIRALVRSPDKAKDLEKLGVGIRKGDYDQPASLNAAFAGADKVLLISGNEVGRRVAQHRAVIDAAKAAGVGLIGYTSVLHADTSPLALRVEHQATEALLKDSGVPFVLLRNGWYTENYMASVPAALQHGAFIGSAGEGRISSAARIDYAAAAAAVLSRNDQAGRVHELAGDEAYTLSQLAAEISRQSGRSIPYQDLPEAAFKAALTGAGLPEPLAALLADSDVGASKGGLFDQGRRLSQLIGRPTTPLSVMVKAAVG